MARIIWSEESLAWLREIDQYVAQTSNAAAVSVLEGIISKVEILREHPRLGAQLADFSEREIREVLYGRYRIIYEFAEETDAVNILAIIHGAMDIDRMRF